MKLGCHACGRSEERDDKPSRRELCEGCGAELHCCLNCRFFDETAYNNCAEPAAERVVDKEKANFCDYFTCGDAARPGAAGSNGAKDTLEGLFKK